MAPVERIPLPFRWEFIPVERPLDRSIHWRWRAVSHSGDFVLEANELFDTLTECKENAAQAGYQDPEGRDFG